MSFQEHYYKASFATFDKKHYRTGKIDFIFFPLTVVMMTWEDQVITPKNCRPLNSWAVLANRRQSLAVYDPSSQLIWGGEDGEEEGPHFWVNIFGFAFPKTWQPNFRCLYPNPVLQALRWLCMSVLLGTFRTEWLAQYLARCCSFLQSAKRKQDTPVGRLSRSCFSPLTS